MATDTPARIAVLGAGPIGLEAALYGRYLGYEVDIYERGRVGQNLLAWGHVRMFTPFGASASPLGLAALHAQDANYQPPAADEPLTGRELVDRYLAPLARSDLLVDGLHEHAQVVSIGRDGPLKGELPDDESRGDWPFRILLREGEGVHPRERIATADIVIDATGVYGNHNWLGVGGVPACGELAAEPHIEYGLPDILGHERQNYAARNVLVIGDGHSAAASVVALAELARHTPGTWITWLTRWAPQPDQRGPVQLLPNDSLPQREHLARAANALTADDAEHVTFYPGTAVEAIAWHADLARFVVRLAGRHSEELEFDRIIANVGYRPEHRLHAELHVEPHAITGGVTSLVQPEPDFYILGSKSRGRDSRFFITDGLAQIRELFAIIGDRADLDIYATMGKIPASQGQN